MIPFRKLSKTKTGSEKRLINRLTYVCLLFPQARKEGKGRHAIFLFEGKAFAYHLSNHRENGINGICCKASSGQIESSLAAQPEKWYRPAYLESKGWLGLRLDSNTDWHEVYNFVLYSYLCTAPHFVEGLKPIVGFGGSANAPSAPNAAPRKAAAHPGV